MIVTCEECGTRFNLNDNMVKPSGSKVRCSKCSRVFKVYPSVSATPPSSAPEEPSIEITDFPYPSTDIPLAGKSLSHQDDDISLQPLETTVIESSVEAEFPDLDIQPRTTDESVSASTTETPQSDDFEIPDLDTMLQPPEEKQTADSAISQLDDLDIPDLDTMLQPPEEKQATDSAISQLDDLDISDLDTTLQHSEEKQTTTALSTSTQHEKPEIQDAPLEDFDSSLDIDISDLLMDTSIDEIPASGNNVKDAVKTDMAQTSAVEPIENDIPDAFSDIEALDLSNLESFLDKQETSVTASNQGERPDSSIQSKPDKSGIPRSDADYSFEEDHFLSFEELQLDTNTTEDATIMEKKESFQDQHPIPSSISPEPQHDNAVIQEQPQRDKMIEKDLEGEEDSEEDVDLPATPSKKGMSKPLLVILIIVLIGAGGYGLYTLLDSMGVHLASPPTHKVQDPGNLKITPFDINSKFVDNNKIGKLFVITGKVKNEYPTNRGAIQVTGKLYTKDKKMAKAETVFCGNMLSDIDQSNLDAAAIQQRLQNRMGDNHVNVQVKPGDAIPFMIVFTNLPENLDEFTLEVIASTPS